MANVKIINKAIDILSLEFCLNIPFKNPEAAFRSKTGLVITIDKVNRKHQKEWFTMYHLNLPRTFD